MNPIFLAAVRSRGGPGAPIRTAAGTIPAHVSPPAEPAETTTGSLVGLASTEARPVPQVQVASADSSGGIGSLVVSLFGSKSEGEARAARDTSVFPASTPQTKPAHPAIAAAGAMAPKFRSQPVNTKLPVPTGRSRQLRCRSHRRASSRRARPRARPRARQLPCSRVPPRPSPPGALTTALDRGVNPRGGAPRILLDHARATLGDPAPDGKGYFPALGRPQCSFRPINGCRAAVLRSLSHAPGGSP